MQANASVGAKVLPIARISMRKTGKLITTAEASGKTSGGRQPPMRLRSHESEGAYASENKRATMMSENTVVLCRSLPPSSEKVTRIGKRQSNHDPMEIDSNCIVGVLGARTSSSALSEANTPCATSSHRGR